MNLYKLSLLFCPGLLLALLANAHQITGIVLSASDKKPIAAASVFFSNTSIGTVTDNQGAFKLDNIPAGKYDLITSYVGFETRVITVAIPASPEPIEILLSAKPNELDNVVIEPYEKDNWERWGQFFLESFIGTSAFAKDCRIVDTHGIYFRFYKRSNRLAAFCDEPLVIENKALGYTIKYQLDKFEYNFKTHLLFYQAYPLFEEMATNNNKRKEHWQQRRKEAYDGSVMHFMRSLYRNHLSEDGFGVHFMQKFPNVEKQRIQLIAQQGGFQKMADSSAYYDRILHEPDFTDKIDPMVLPGDSIAYAIDSVTAGLYFPDYLLITYNKKEPIEYAQMQNRSPLKQCISTLWMVEKKEIITVIANGNYYPPLNLIRSGFWSFWEKIATMLPMDYEPSL